MVVQAVRGDRLRLLEVVREQPPVFALFILDLITGKQVIEAAVEAVRQVEGALRLPDHPGEGRGHLLLVRRDAGGAEDELQDLQARLFDLWRVLGAQQRFGQVRVAEIDPVELTIELGQHARERPVGAAPVLPAVVPRHPLALGRECAHEQAQEERADGEEGVQTCHVTGLSSTL